MQSWNVNKMCDFSDVGGSWSHTGRGLSMKKTKSGLNGRLVVSILHWSLEILRLFEAQFHLSGFSYFVSDIFA